MIKALCKSTNKYVWIDILELHCYAERDGPWKEVTPDKLLKFTGLVIYMGIAYMPHIHILYWNASRLLSGLLPLNIMPRRFSALLRFPSATDPEATTVALCSKLHQILWLLPHVNT